MEITKGTYAHLPPDQAIATGLAKIGVNQVDDLGKYGNVYQNELVLSVCGYVSWMVAKSASTY